MNKRLKWVDHTFNPWIGCAKVHAGCTHCYAEAFANRTGKARWGPHGTRVKTSEAYWLEPLQWNREAERAGVRRRVFCASLADVFEDWNMPVVDHRGNWLLRCDGCGAYYPDDDDALSESCGKCGRFKQRMQWAKIADLRRDLFALIDQTPWLDWILVTKRPENICSMWYEPSDDNPYSPTPHSDGRSNVWLLASISDQETADRMVPELLKCRDLVPVLGVSAEPLLGPVELPARIDWVIVGGESGPRARPLHPAWVRSLRDQCQAAGVAYFMKQIGGARKPFPEIPNDLMIREFPEGQHAAR